MSILKCFDWLARVERLVDVHRDLGTEKSLPQGQSKNVRERGDAKTALLLREWAGRTGGRGAHRAAPAGPGHRWHHTGGARGCGGGGRSRPRRRGAVTSSAARRRRRRPRWTSSTRPARRRRSRGARSPRRRTRLRTAAWFGESRENHSTPRHPRSSVAVARRRRRLTSSPDARLDRMDVILPASSAWRLGRGRACSATDRATAGEMRTRTASESASSDQT